MRPDCLNTSPTNKVALEDLLKLKRAERPGSEFWVRFEEDLRAKQLAAIVAKRPWWQLEVGRWPAALWRLRVPVGATAVLALGFLTLREYRFAGRSLPMSDGSQTAMGSPVAVSEISDVADPVDSPAVLESRAGVISVPEVSVAQVSVSNEAPKRVDSSSRVASGMIPWVGDASLIAAPTGETSSTPTLVESMPTAALAMIGGNLLAEGLAVAKRDFGGIKSRTAPVEPLSQVASQVSGTRRAWLASYVPSNEKSESFFKSTLDAVRERATSRLNDEQLYNNVSRLGAATNGGLKLSF